MEGAGAGDGPAERRPDGLKKSRYMAERERNRRKENTARQGVPVEDLEQFARFLLPKIQAFYETEEGQRAFQEWKKRNKN